MSNLLNAGPWCAQCRAGGSQAEADWYVEGMAQHSGAARPMPYRGNICDEHKALLEEEGARWRVQRRFSSAWVRANAARTAAEKREDRLNRHGEES